MLEWDLLRIVLAIHRRGSMAAAAEELGVDRATVLRRLDSLEAKLNSRLFDRRTDGCVLSEAGRNIIGLVEGVEQAMTALSHRLEGEAGRAEGVVRVAGPEFILCELIAPATATLLKLHPGMSFDLRTDHDRLDLARGEADIAIRFARPANEMIVARRVASVAVALFATSAYFAKRGKPGPDGFEGHDLAVLEGALGQLPAMGWLLGAMRGTEVVLRANEVAPILAAARAGTAIACIPAIAAERETTLEPVYPGVVGRFDLFLATHRDLRKRGRVRYAYDFLARLFTQHAAELSDGKAASFFKAAAVPVTPAADRGSGR